MKTNTKKQLISMQGKTRNKVKNRKNSNIRDITVIFYWWVQIFEIFDPQTLTLPWPCPFVFFFLCARSNSPSVDIVPLFRYSAIKKMAFFKFLNWKMVGILKIPYYAFSLWPPPKPSLEWVKSGLAREPLQANPGSVPESHLRGVFYVRKSRKCIDHLESV